MLVSELMSASVVTVTPQDTALEASRLLDRYNIGALPVCSGDGLLRGIVTDRDIVTRCLAAELSPAETPVRDIMSKSVLSVSPGDDVRVAGHRMAEGRVRRVPVAENGRVVGMLSLGDIASTQDYSMEASATLAEISSNFSRL
ncbi:MAG: CBS domain-containing protein [Clostridiales bacterium]|nr:CBS domain-containing protein [Clostridiales bacterium]